MCLRSVSAVSSSPDLISLLDSLSAFRHPYVPLSSLAMYSRYFRCNTRIAPCMPNGSRNNCLTGMIRYGIRLHTYQRRWAWPKAQSYSFWLVLMISRLMPALRISLNEVITSLSEVEGLSGSTARPFYLSA